MDHEHQITLLLPRVWLSPGCCTSATTATSTGFA